tara:strand:+ start:57 stop:203 length:147 start_codon:yes stop_codon:yes gene_type:complete
MSRNLSFLKTLNIGATNIGCFNGKEWAANGSTYAVNTPIDNTEVSKVT